MGRPLKKVIFEDEYAQMSGSTLTYMFFRTYNIGSVKVIAYNGYRT